MKRQKYGNQKVTFQGMTFDSEGEMARFIFLSNRQKEGKISGLNRQREYLLLPAQYRSEIKHLKTKIKVVQRLVERPCVYKADFVYFRGDELVVEDFKGAKFLMTADFKLKKKLMLYMHDIEVKIVTNPTYWEEKV